MKLLPVLALGMVVESCVDDALLPYSVQKPTSVAQYEYLNNYDVLKSYLDRAKNPNFKLGLAASVSDFVQQGVVYEAVTTNFDEMTAGNAMKYASVVADDGTMNFSTVSNFVDVAKAAGITIYGHTLGWHAQQNMTYLNGLIADKEITVDPGEKKAADEVKKIVFACDAGMGSSAMGATKFRNRVKAQRPDLTVINTSVDNIPADCDIAVVQAVLADRARKSAPQAQLVIINNFLQDPNLDGLYEQMTAKVDPAVQTAAAVEEKAETPVVTGNSKILVEEGIKTGLKPVDKFEAIKAAGKLLNELGYVEEGYIDAMVKREQTVTTYMGLGVAIPHGTGDAKKKVQKTGIVMLQYPEGVDFDGEKAQLVFGIAGIGDEHLGLLAKISEIIEDPERLEQLKTTENVDEIMEMFK